MGSMITKDEEKNKLSYSEVREDVLRPPYDTNVIDSKRSHFMCPHIKSRHPVLHVVEEDIFQKSFFVLKVKG